MFIPALCCLQKKKKQIESQRAKPARQLHDILRIVVQFFYEFLTVFFSKIREESPKAHNHMPVQGKKNWRQKITA